jgi:malate synthase
MASTTIGGLIITGSLDGRFGEVLSPGACEFLTELHRRFNPRRLELLQARHTRQAALESSGSLPGFNPDTAAVRGGNWKVAPAPKDLQVRSVVDLHYNAEIVDFRYVYCPFSLTQERIIEICGAVERKVCLLLWHQSMCFATLMGTAHD